MRKIIREIHDELKDAEHYIHRAEECPDFRGEYYTLANEELTHAEALIQMCNRLEKDSEEKIIWDYEKENCLQRWRDCKVRTGM